MTGEGKWRVGRKLGRTLYVDDVVIGMVDHPEVAAMIAGVMNAASDVATSPSDRNACGVCTLPLRDCDRDTELINGEGDPCCAGARIRRALRGAAK